MTTVSPVPFDPEIGRLIAQLPDMPTMTAETIPQQREMMNAMLPSAEEVIGDRPVEVEERTIAGQAGGPDLEIVIFRPRGATRSAPGLYNMHGGGLVTGNRHADDGRLVDLVLEFGAVAISVEYRLAPENPGIGLAEDCYAGLTWMAGHADELGIDPARLIVMGGSAGGNLAASMALMARDRGGPDILGQLLLTPMLDDRNETVSSHQYAGLGTWTRETNEVAWHAVLGDDVGGDDVSPYIAPARATDLSNLPPAFIELGSAELFRDEGIEYASRIWATGGEAELHVWSGGCHGYDVYFPQCELTGDALAARSTWLRRLLSR